MTNQIAYWVARGNVRRDCPHKHRTYEAAEECAERDRRAIARLPGGTYSDRSAAAIDDQGYEVAVVFGWDGEER